MGTWAAVTQDGLSLCASCQGSKFPSKGHANITIVYFSHDMEKMGDKWIEFHKMFTGVWVKTKHRGMEESLWPLSIAIVRQIRDFSTSKSFLICSWNMLKEYDTAVYPHI